MLSATGNRQVNDTIEMSLGYHECVEPEHSTVPSNSDKNIKDSHLDTVHEV